MWVTVICTLTGYYVIHFKEALYVRLLSNWHCRYIASLRERKRRYHRIEARPIRLGKTDRACIAIPFPWTRRWSPQKYTWRATESTIYKGSCHNSGARLWQRVRCSKKLFFNTPSKNPSDMEQRKENQEDIQGDRVWKPSNRIRGKRQICMDVLRLYFVTVWIQCHSAPRLWYRHL